MPSTISQGDWYARPVSSVATASRDATSEPAEATAASRTRRPGVSVDAALAVVLAAAFAAIVFVATGGADLGPNTWVEIALLAVGAGSAVALVLVPARGPGTAPGRGSGTAPGAVAVA